ncbi:1-aminocyclopropane-1-carboxylate oxidase [Lachnellula occidentalis]|uniref:1-aminocyclopropane-1-carboxylate oxidase n=1 Tax=Lachnellula occidentalis TaxID=215460 RepID=A0A8H8UFS0_9HELO|nr:1-aminocyclopropane-1-carboxylate oxidase [Lachnellula occidentalis]
MSSPIPQIDLSLFASPSTRLQVSRDLVRACHETGFVYISGHGIPSSLIAEAFSWSRAFYALGEEQKGMARRREGSKVFRGWNGVGKEQVPELEGEKREGVVDWTEAYGLGTDGNADQPNQWPPSFLLPGFRAFMLSFQDECWAVSQEILLALSLGLGLPSSSSLLQYHAQGENELSLRHYPAVHEDAVRSGEVDRLGAHTDFDSFTLLWQDELGGLEVRDKSGRWVDVRPVEGALVMNIGDVLQRWSNDFLISTLHRVHLPPLDDSYESQDGKRKTLPRFSIPYFVVPKRDTVLEPLEGDFGEKQQKKYKPVLSGEYQAKKIEGIFR